MAIAWKAAVNSGISGAASQIPIGPTRTRSHDEAATAPDVYSFRQVALPISKGLARGLPIVMMFSAPGGEGLGMGEFLVFVP
jgi:hypothetical protein